MFKKDIDMTIKQYYKLKPYEDTLFTSKYCDYFRNLTQKARIELDEVYQELFKEASSINAGCGSCQLRSLKKLAEPYFKMKEKMDKKKEQEPEVVDENNPVENNDENGTEE